MATVKAGMTGTEVETTSGLRFGRGCTGQNDR